MFGIDRPCYTIKIVSKQLDLHPQTIRGYERMGLIKPERTKGNVRLFSSGDVAKLKKIIAFRNMGINLPGIEVVMKLLGQIEELRRARSNLEEKFRMEFNNKFIKNM